MTISTGPRSLVPPYRTATVPRQRPYRNRGRRCGGSGLPTYWCALGLSPTQIVMVDSRGVVREGEQRSKHMSDGPASANPRRGASRADVFLGVSSPNIVTVDMLQSMAGGPLILALANPDLDAHRIALVDRTQHQSLYGSPGGGGSETCLPVSG